MHANQQGIVRRSALAALLLIVGLLPAAAQQIPPLSGRVVDNASVISGAAESEITAYLAALEEQSGIQMAVLTVSSLGGVPLEEYSIRVVEEWELGQAGEDNGVLLLIATQEKQMRLEVGYGLEGTLTDAASGVIIREYLQPAFRAGDFDGGIKAAVSAVASVTTDTSTLPAMGDVAPRRSADSRSRSSGGAPIFGLGNIVLFGLFIMMGNLRRMRRYGHRRGSGVGSAIFWGSVAGSAARRRSGFGGSGGFSGGGFSGGGGGFGGGGASGGW